MARASDHLCAARGPAHIEPAVPRAHDQLVERDDVVRRPARARPDRDLIRPRVRADSDVCRPEPRRKVGEFGPQTIRMLRRLRTAHLLQGERRLLSEKIGKPAKVPPGRHRAQIGSDDDLKPARVQICR